MALHPCPRCRALIPVGLPYCDTCRPIAESELQQHRLENLKRKQQRYNRRRDPKYLAFYRSKEWKTLSRVYLQNKKYKCEAKEHHPDCTGLAVEVHHKQPIQTPEGWDLRLDWDNLEALSTACHNCRHPEKGAGSTPAGVIDLRFISR